MQAETDDLMLVGLTGRFPFTQESRIEATI
jgi:hypothetical protein